ncbi:hypothetical protein P4U24_08885 [Aeribacillus composti]|uniref:hypothetical protein n=1 Tax=Aeribacillus composti TaxID=1868734 RepID=UPI002E1C723A|nr:hypothetical protein [Aeribacillus composti]
MSIQLNFNDNYSKIYGSKYTKKMNFLVRVITEYETENQKHDFNVLNFEAGLGKSFTVNRLLQEIVNYHWDFKKKFLIVKRFNEDSIKSVDFVEDEFVKGSAVAITHENWKKWQSNLEELKTKQIIFISHERYISLCENEELRQVFVHNRDIMIIDEKVNFPVYTYNDERFNEIFQILPNDTRELLIKVCKPLNNFIDLQKTLKQTNKVFTHRFKIHPATLKNFIEECQIAIDNFTIKETKHRNKVKDFIKELPFFYSNQCIYNSNNISTYNSKHKHWGLKNNIILDASAAIDGVYYCNRKNKFKVIEQSRIIDHRDSNFYIYKFNSSKSNILKYKDKYFAEMAQHIIQNRKSTDKTLIITHKGKDFAEKIHNELIQLHNQEDVWIDKKDKKKDKDYENQSIAISWYGNLIGKDWARDFTQVWLLSTPNIPLEHYLIQFLHYSDDKIGNKSTELVKGKYKNANFKAIQNGYVAAEMYQALKRIQRVPLPKGDFFIVSDKEDLITSILSQIKNAEITKEYELNFMIEEKEEMERQKKLNKKPDQVDMFIEFVLNEKKGTYKKSDVAKQLKISKINRVLSDTRVKTLLNKRLKIHTRKIELI